MWNWADDDGIGRCVEKELLGFAFPYDDMTVGEFHRHVGAIHRHFGVVFYMVRGRPYFYIPTFHEHQKRDPRFKGRHPKPDEAETLLYQDVSENVGGTPRHVGESQENHAIGTGEQGNKEQGNKERESVASVAVVPAQDAPAKAVATKQIRGCRLPSNYMPSQEAIDLIKAEFPNITQDTIASAHRQFCDYWSDQPGQKGVKITWDGTWKVWMRREFEKGTGRRRNNDDKIRELMEMEINVEAE
jgi:hypothetical protein